MKKIKQAFFILIILTFIISCSVSGRKKSTSPEYLCVITYNIHHGVGIDGTFDLKRIADLIRENDADLVALQEVDVETERTGGLNTMEYLARELSMYFAFGKNLEFQGGGYGNGILSKYPLVSIENLHIPPYQSGEQRGILKILVDYNGRELAFWNIHLDHRKDDTERRESVRIIKKKTEDLNIPIILAGDFNDTPESKALSELNTVFEDVWAIKENDKGFTFPSDKPERRIDYVFFRSPNVSSFMLQPVNARVLTSPASDHLPLIVHFRILNVRNE